MGHVHQENFLLDHKNNKVNKGEWPECHKLIRCGKVKFTKLISNGQVLKVEAIEVNRKVCREN